MKTYGNFFEDIEQRRVALAQRKKDQMARLKQKSVEGESETDELVSSHQKQISQDQADADAKRQEAKQKRDAAIAAREKEKEDKEKEKAMKDDIRQDLANERDEKRRDIEKKRMEKERAQAED